jgi:DNA-binding NtrC family response regulator
VSEPVVEPQHLPEPLAASIGSKDHAAQQIEATSLAQLARTVLRLPAENKLDAVEAALVTEAMRLAQGNKSAAARLLGVHRRVVERRLDKHGGTGSSGSSSNSGDS